MRLHRSALITLLIVLGVGGVVGYKYAVDLPASQRTADQFAAELAAIAAPDGLQLVNAQAYARPGLSVAFRRYNGSITTQSARDYYGGALQRTGWSLISDTSDTESDRRCWHRGDDQATLDVSGDRELGGSSYLLTLSRGLTMCR